MALKAFHNRKAVFTLLPQELDLPTGSAGSTFLLSHMVHDLIG